MQLVARADKGYTCSSVVLPWCGSLAIRFPMYSVVDSARAGAGAGAGGGNHES